ILVDRCEIDLRILRIGKLGGEYFQEVGEEVSLEDWILNVGCGSLLSPRICHLFSIGRESECLATNIDLEPFGLVGRWKRNAIVSKFLPFHRKTPTVTGVSLKTVERYSWSRLFLELCFCLASK